MRRAPNVPTLSLTGASSAYAMSSRRRSRSDTSARTTTMARPRASPPYESDGTVGDQGLLLRVRKRGDAQDLAVLQCRRQLCRPGSRLVAGDGLLKVGQRGCRTGLFRPEFADLRLLRG